MTGNRTFAGSTMGRGWNRPGLWMPTVVTVAAMVLLPACAARGAGQSPGSGSEPPIGATTAPTTEAAPSAGVETAPTEDTPGGNVTGGTVHVNGPTLGSNFSGTGEWGPNDVALTDLRITIPRGGDARYNFGVFSLEGESGLTYGRTTLSPDDGYFQLTSSCAPGTPIPTSSEAADDNPEQCNLLAFVPSSKASASDPFDAEMVVGFHLTCDGQSNPTCRQTPSAQSAGPDRPVVLDFSRTVRLHGSISDDHATEDVGATAIPAPVSTSESAPAGTSPPGDQSVEPTGRATR